MTDTPNPLPTAEKDAIYAPPGTLIHLATNPTCVQAVCERNGKDWTGAGDFYLAAPGGPNERNVTCRDCVFPPGSGDTQQGQS